MLCTQIKVAIKSVHEFQQEFWNGRPGLRAASIVSSIAIDCIILSVPLLNDAHHGILHLLLRIVSSLHHKTHNQAAACEVQDALLTTCRQQKQLAGQQKAPKQQNQERRHASAWGSTDAWAQCLPQG